MLALLKTITDAIANWWSDFNLQTRLLAAVTLVVSLVMSGLTFWAVNTIQQDARLNDTRFGRDLGLLLAANVVPFMADGNYTEIAQFSQRFYSSTSSVRYLLYADETGKIFFGIPFWEPEVGNSLTIKRKIELPEDYGAEVEKPMVRHHNSPDGEVTDVFVPLKANDKYLGVLAVGINPNQTAVISTNFTRDVTIAVFISIWVMVILGGVINALTITKPIKELLAGVKQIAAGNFKQRIELQFSGELKELIVSFNEMGERLEGYEEQNIEELTAEKAKLETLVSTIADGAVLIDNEMQVILANSTAKRIFGWEETQVVGNTVLDYLPEQMQLEINRYLQQMTTGELESAEFRITINQPVKRTIRIVLTTVINQQRESIKGIAITIQDITREVELNEAKSQFISNVSHELRTPLFNIKSFIETLHEFGEDLGVEQRKEFLQTVNNETDRLTRLVNDVLDLSKLESGRSYSMDGVDLGQAVEQTLRTYQLNAKDKGIELIQDVAPNLPLVRGHYDLLLQVLANLIGNALKFTKAGGKVALRAYQLRSQQELHTLTPPVRVEICDTGIGIAGVDQQAIFDRFFRVENLVHTLEGTGLGLSIVRNILEDKHHTKVFLVSEVGIGTTFWFDLEVFEETLNNEQLKVNNEQLGVRS
jgi:two-component system sensor histidine kinase NblS